MTRPELTPALQSRRYEFTYVRIICSTRFHARDREREPNRALLHADRYSDAHAQSAHNLEFDRRMASRAADRTITAADLPLLLGPRLVGRLAKGAR